MKVPFRVTLLTLLLVLLGVTVSVVGVTSYLHARSNADELASQLLEQTSRRIDQEIDRFLRQATEHATRTQDRLKSGQLRVDDFPALIAYWRNTMDMTAELTGCFIGLEKTGESVGLSRLSGRLSVWQTHRDPRTGDYDIREFWPTDYPTKPFALDRSKPRSDVRARPWYVAASRAGRPVWTEAYVFTGVKGIQHVLGVTYAVPLYDKDRKLVAVLDADFELKQLCRFCRALQLGRGGFSFVIEGRGAAGQQVIAYPREDLLLGTPPGVPPGTRSLIDPEAFPDARVSAFAAQREALGAGQVRSHPFDYEAGGVSYLGLARPLEGPSDPPWTVCVVLPEEEVLGRVHRSNQMTLLIGVGVLVLGVLLSLFVAAQVARPLERLAREADAVGHFQIAPQPIAHSFVREVDRLAVAMEDMKGGLRSFQKYVPADLVRALLASRQDANLSGELRTVTIFFSDVADFTAIAEELRPEELVERLREYLTALSQEIQATGGTVDKYIGDAVMAFWGAPTTDPEQAQAACAAALRCQAALQGLHARWRAQGRQPFATRIGVHTGEVVVGNIGSEARLNYTVIGDAVNLASRLEGLNKHYGTRILISESTFQAAGATVVARPIDYVSVKGKRRPVLIYELLGPKGEAEAGSSELAAVQGEALARYRQQDWEEAIRLFERVLALRADDPPARLMIARCRAYQASPPGPEWDGVYRLDSK